MRPRKESSKLKLRTVHAPLTWNLGPGTVQRLNQLLDNYESSAQGVPRTFVSGAWDKNNEWCEWPLHL